MELNKTSIRFFNDMPIRSAWDDESAKWLMCASDVIDALVETTNPRIYWATIKRRNPELFANCKQFKLVAGDGKFRKTDVIDDSRLIALMTIIRSPKKDIFRRWLTSLNSSIDEKSKEKAYELYESGALTSMEVGTIKGLQQIHAYIFGGLYDFAGQIRSKNISKSGFLFANAAYLPQILCDIENMPESSLPEIVQKYVEMNIAHPFMEGNGRSTRIWLDQILKKNLEHCVDWSLINKRAYMLAMEKSPSDISDILILISNALTEKINDRETFMKGIDYSYYYEYEWEEGSELG